MESANLGRIACPVGALDTYRHNGTRVGNGHEPRAAIIGTDEESDFASRQRRRNTLALQGISTSEAVTSRLYAIDGVRSLGLPRKHHGHNAGYRRHYARAA